MSAKGEKIVGKSPVFIGQTGGAFFSSARPKGSIEGALLVQSEARSKLIAARPEARSELIVARPGVLGLRVYRRGFEVSGVTSQYFWSKGVSIDFRQRSFKVFFRFHLTFLVAKKDMHTYISQLKGSELETLISTYGILLDLRPCLPDPNFRMINLPVRDTTIGIYSRIFDSSGVRIPFSSFLLAVIKHFKVHISQLVPMGLSKVVTFEVLCRSLNIEPTLTLFRVFQTLSKQVDWFFFDKRRDPAPVCMEDTKSRYPNSRITYEVPTDFNQDHIDRIKAHIVRLRDIPEGVLVRSGVSKVWRNPMCDLMLRHSDNTVMSIYNFLCMPSLNEEETVIIRPDRKVVTKADNAAKRKAFIGSEVSTNATKKTKVGKKGSGAGSGGQATRGGAEQVDDGTLNDDDQGDDTKFVVKDIESFNDVSQDKEVEPHAELSRGARRTTRASSHASHGTKEDASHHAQGATPALDTQPQDVDDDGNGSDDIVDHYYEARLGNTIGDVLERDLLPLAPGPYYIPYLYDEGSSNESHPYTKDDWEEIHGVNLGMPKKSFTRILRNVKHLSKWHAQQTQTIKQQNANLRKQSEFTIRANEEVCRLKTQLGVLESRCQAADKKLSSWDKKHMKYKAKRDAIAVEKAKVEEELVKTKFLKSGKFNQASACVLAMAISVGEKFDSAVAAFSATTFPFLDKVSQSSQSSLQDIARPKPDKVVLLRKTSFGHTSTPEHLKKKKFVGTGAPSYSLERNYYVRKGKVSVYRPSAAKSISKGCLA
ncbi:hypothetical protein Tco_0895576 [Tanacetum coccineum]|uniref:Transposase (putative) gypsy type domain-containing protein n=1 Tax=Tanacetum coccineum TaxID=301880 RepID=A0ABQ5CG62_9ASTR